MKHICLAPHLDDAVLSCGGAMHHHARAGDPVQVITVFSGEFTGKDLSPFALKQHRDWGNAPQVMALRRAEDAAAMAFLGARAQYLDHLDAIYRTDSEGQWLYHDLETLFGEIHPADPLALDGARALAERLTSLIPGADLSLVYAPLAAGRHVDHQIVHMAARRLVQTGYQVTFYEDYPYAEQPGAVEAALLAAGAERWRAEDISLDVADVSAQVTALGYYRTQLDILFGGAEAMPNRVWTFAATRSSRTCLTERMWWLSEA
jgi:LmbE family N-acetylglucosaminyl deacetylase